jgi:hypothetical protein
MLEEAIYTRTLHRLSGWGRLSDIGPELSSSDDIFDGIPYARTPEGDTNWLSRTHFTVEPKAPYVEVTYRGGHRGLTHSEQGRLRVMRAVHTASEVMGLSSDEEAEVADLVFRYLKGVPRVKSDLLRLVTIASAIAVMWRKGTAVRAEDVYRAYEALGGTLEGERDRKALDYALNATMIELFRRLQVRSDKDGLRESAARTLAGELGLDDSSSVVLVALAKAINEKPINAANAAATAIAYLIGHRRAVDLWKVVWPSRSQRIRIDGITIVLGDGDHTEAEAEEGAAKVVCSHCGAVIFDSRNVPRIKGSKASELERFSSIKWSLLSSLMRRVPQRCPVCNAMLIEDGRALIRSIGLAYHISNVTSEGFKIVKRKVGVALPKGASLKIS